MKSYFLATVLSMMTLQFCCFCFSFLPTAEVSSTETGEASGNSTDLLGRVRLGDTVSNNGYSMVVNEMVDPATPLASFNQTPGERTIAVYVTFKNDSNETPFHITLASVTLLASDSFIYGTFPMIVDDELATVDLAQGEEVSGWVGFEISNDEKPLVFTYKTQTVKLESRLK